MFSLGLQSLGWSFECMPCSQMGLKTGKGSVYHNMSNTAGFPGDSVGKESFCNAGDPGNMGSTSGSGRFPGGGHGNRLQYSCLENTMDKGAWWATVHRVAESDMTEAAEHAQAIQQPSHLNLGKIASTNCSTCHYILSHETVLIHILKQSTL